MSSKSADADRCSPPRGGGSFVGGGGGGGGGPSPGISRARPGGGGRANPRRPGATGSSGGVDTQGPHRARASTKSCLIVSLSRRTNVRHGVPQQLSQHQSDRSAGARAGRGQVTVIGARDYGMRCGSTPTRSRTWAERIRPDRRRQCPERAGSAGQIGQQHAAVEDSSSVNVR